MPDFPIQLKLVNRNVITPYSPESLGAVINNLSVSINNSVAWPTANLAIFVPFEVYNPITIVKMAVNNGTVVSGNIDVGIYNTAGTKKVSIGTTAQTGTSAIQIFDITDTLLNPGNYYMAVALDNATGTLNVFNTGIAQDLGGVGCYQMASAFVLPATATYAAFAQTLFPLVGMFQRTTI